MVNLFTNDDFVDKEKFIVSNNGFFYINIRPWMLSEHHKIFIKEIIKKYDHSEVIDTDGIPLIRTRHNMIVDIDKLSTGLKTLLNVYYITENIGIYGGYAIDVTECGRNFLLDIFTLANNTELSIVLRHTRLPDFINLKVKVDDGEIIDNKDDLIIYYMNCLERRYV